MGDDQNGTLQLFLHVFEYTDQVFKTPQINSGFRLIKKRKPWVPLAMMVAISILFNSPPERLALTSRTM